MWYVIGVMDTDLYNVIIFSPTDSADSIRQALSEAGAGNIGNYDSCSFSCKGTGRFRPLKGADPSIGSQDKLEEVEEERIEVIVDARKLDEVIASVKKIHPYEEPAIHVLSISRIS